MTTIFIRPAAYWFDSDPSPPYDEDMAHGKPSMLGAYGDWAGASEAFRISMHLGPHKFDLAMQKEAFAWFERRLR
jgi:hypothetical protein